MRIPARAAAAAVLALAAGARPAAAQTDYYNTDRGRPVRIEDASPVERYAFELQLAPVRLEREGGGAYSWGVAPELAYGILPRTQVEVGFPIVYVDGADDNKAGLAGIEVAALHNLNIETRTLPALAVGAEVLLPVGSLAPDAHVRVAQGDRHPHLFGGALSRERPVHAAAPTPARTTRPARRRGGWRASRWTAPFRCGRCW